MLKDQARHLRRKELAMSTPAAQIPEALRIRLIPHGDPPSWLLGHLNREQLVQIYRLQLDYERALNAAQGKFLDGVAAALK